MNYKFEIYKSYVMFMIFVAVCKGASTKTLYPNIFFNYQLR
jgi:hypothetical protein